MKMQHITFYGKYLLINYSSTLTSAQLLTILLYTIIDTLACFFPQISWMREGKMEGSNLR